MIQCPPKSGVVLWVDCRPQPVSGQSWHTFKVESARSNTVRNQLRSATVRVGATAGLQLGPGGGSGRSLTYKPIGPISPGQTIGPFSTSLQKQVGTSARTADVEVKVSFSAMPLPGRTLPPGSGATILGCTVTVTIA
jgi:hypothetical protein